MSRVYVRSYQISIVCLNMCMSCKPIVTDTFGVEYCRDLEIWVRVVQCH